jgi:hypothetical protein
MRRIVFFLLSSLLCIQPLMAQERCEPVKDCIRIFERLVVDFPANEAQSWNCVYAEQGQNGASFEVWQCDRNDAYERIVVLTTPWNSKEEEQSLDQALGELLAPYKALPMTENIVIEKEFNGDEVFVSVIIDKEYAYFYKLTVTPFGVHIASFNHKSKDLSLLDRERANKILKEWCYIVY